MDTKTAPSSRLLVYDGDCPLCGRASAGIVRWARLADDARRSHLAFEGDLAGRLDAAGIRNEMAVLDPSTGEIRSGLDGILWFLLPTRRGWAARLLCRARMRAPATVLYRLVAYNRRVIAPPVPRAYACACDPDPRLAYNLAFTAIVAGVACTWGAAAAFLLADVAGVGARETARAALLAAGLPLVGMAGAAAAASRGRLAAAGHVGWVAAALALPLAVLCAALVTPTLFGWPWLGGRGVRVRWLPLPVAVRTGLCVAAGLAGALAGALSLRRRLPALRGLRVRGWPRGGVPP